MDIIKISMIGVCGVMLGFILKGIRPEYASFITIAIGLMILGLAVGKVSYLFETLNRLKESLPIDGNYFATLIKIIGITYIGQFASSICKDAGYQAVGAQIELFCKLSVMILSMPVLLAILDTIQGFMV
ncbi:MAG: SpoIIIAC/SpoIIIAD family protein [Blautia sp.]|nr:SpoIIIAC/SpoIIIAD family protein [Blautia sp.]